MWKSPEADASRRWMFAAAGLIAGTAIVMAGYFALIPSETRIWIRAGLSLAFLSLFVPARRDRDIGDTLLAFFAVSTGLLVAGLFLSDIAGRLGIPGNDPRGFAIGKMSETLPIVVMILVVVLASGGTLSSLSLTGGRVWRSLFGGLAVGAVLFGYFLANGGWQVFQGPNLRTLLPTIGWVALFSLFNGFMEELWFRGLFQSRLERLVGLRLGFWLTVVLFGLLHVFGNFSGTLGTLLLTGFTILLGIGFGFIVRRTGSIWGAVLGHFFADFFFMLGYFATAG